MHIHGGIFSSEVITEQQARWNSTKPTKPMKRNRKKTGIKATARSITMRTEYFAKLTKLAEDAGHKTTGRWIEAQIDKEMGGE